MIQAACPRDLEDSHDRHIFANKPKYLGYEARLRKTHRLETFLKPLWIVAAESIDAQNKIFRRFSALRRFGIAILKRFVREIIKIHGPLDRLIVNK